jgi:hypothetical protein
MWRGRWFVKNRNAGADVVCAGQTKRARNRQRRRPTAGLHSPLDILVTLWHPGLPSALSELPVRFYLLFDVEFYIVADYTNFRYFRTASRVRPQAAAAIPRLMHAYVYFCSLRTRYEASIMIYLQNADARWLPRPTPSLPPSVPLKSSTHSLPPRTLSRRPEASFLALVSWPLPSPRSSTCLTRRPSLLLDT